MKYPTIALFLLTIALAGCPTSEPSSAGPVNGDSDAGNNEMRPRPDVGGSQNPAVPDDQGPDLAGGDAGGEALPPVARTAERIDAVVGEVVTFDGSASSATDGVVLAWMWDFGDGRLAEGAIVTHAYEAVGEYDASLTVEDERGATDTAAIEVRVTAADSNQPPTAVITLPELPIPVDQEVTFSGHLSSDPDGSLVAYDWELREADSGEIQVLAEGVEWAHVFEQPGEYEVRLRVTDDEGAEAEAVETVPVAAEGLGARMTITPDPAQAGELVRFDAADSVIDASPIATWSWDFGDGNTASGEAVAHIYGFAASYEVSLTVTDGHGQSDTATETLVVLAHADAPVVDAGADRVVLLGQSVALSGSASTVEGVSVASWEWDFGDGSSAAGQNVNHTYAAAGNYEAALTVTDSAGHSGTDRLSVVVHRAPVAVISVLTAAPADTAPVSFSGSASYDPDGDALTSYLWSFGDGVTAVGADVSHTYASAGTYTVGLTVTDALGATGSTTQIVAVECQGGTCGATGDWRVRPFDDELGASGSCSGITIQINPVDCSMTESDGSLSMTCPGGFTYSGTRSGDSFTLSLPQTVIGYDDFCGDIYVSEWVSGSFVTSDFWDADVWLSVDFQFWDPWFCDYCDFDPFPKTGTRL